MCKAMALLKELLAGNKVNAEWEDADLMSCVHYFASKTKLVKVNETLC